MVKKARLNQNQKNLIRRYLLWCYKTTKEDLDCIERYFTQYIVDQKMLKTLKGMKNYKRAAKSSSYRKMVHDFEDYLNMKKGKAGKNKFSDQKHTKLKPEIQYLQDKIAAIEGAIVHFLGRRELTSIIASYENEMTNRILQAREHS